VIDEGGRQTADPAGKEEGGEEEKRKRKGVPRVLKQKPATASESNSIARSMPKAATLGKTID